jgi:hypothetical protein
MVHSGYEASGVNYTFGSLKGLLQTAKAIVFNKYRDPDAMESLREWQPSHPAVVAQVPVTSLTVRKRELQEVAED